MTARTGMATLITTLRGMGAAGTADYSAGGTTFWNDDQVQTVLDRHRAELNNSFCSPVARMVGGVAEFHDYYIGYPNIEGGTVYFSVEDGAGNAYGTADYTADLARGIVSFVADNKGLPVAVTGRTYDINAAAADLWRQKAASVAQAYDFSTDNHRMSRSQMMKQCLEMATMYEGMSVPTNNKIGRDDTIRVETYDDFDRR